VDSANASIVNTVDRDHDDDYINCEIIHAAALLFPDGGTLASASVSKGGDAVVIPRSWREAMRDPDMWMPPMQKEIATLNRKGVWRLEKPPSDSHVVGGMWVYDIKVDGDGHFVKPKARWVA
jgi:hypothetical protein